MSVPNRRKKYIVDREFQTRFILKFCLTVIFVSLAIGVLIFYFTKSSTTVTIENTRVIVKGTQDFIFPVILATVVTVMFFTSLAVFVSTLFASNRIAGPIYRLSREVDRIKQGDLTGSFRIRNKDEFQYLAKNLHEMSTLFRKNYGELKTKMDSLKNFLRENNYNVSGQEKETYLSKAKEIEGLLGYFEV